eukprot:TRINITY_DN3682_c1_g2_i2.p1 TRINITY_DN3682_c1_g2~~TRINITY_DN3682_c1_g2_i2.p1  ORF type:complete len:1261 (+),score=324.14 TRINITY_DN3682_c1_g2_i2:363-3785(+)
MSMVLMINEKFRENVPAWEAFKNEREKFQHFFRRVLALPEHPELTIRERTDFIIFLINCFQSFEDGFVRDECKRLVSLWLWFSVSENRINMEMNHLANEQPAFAEKIKGHWKKLLKKDKERIKKNLAEDHEQEKFFMLRLINDYFTILNDQYSNPDAVKFCERFLEFMIDLVSQLSTRRFLRVLLEDVQFNIRSLRSQLANTPEGTLFKKLLSMLKFYLGFEINDYTGEALTDDEMRKVHYSKLKKLQQFGYKSFEQELKRFALTNIGAVNSRSALKNHLNVLSRDQLLSLNQQLGLLPKEVKDDLDKEYLLEVIISAHEKRQSQIEMLNRDPLYPNEALLWDNEKVPSDQFSGDSCLALPKLNIQFLTFHDYFLRNYTLFRLESTYEIRYDIENAIQRMKPFTNLAGKVEFEGWAKMALPVGSFKITKVGQPDIGRPVPSYVLADLNYTIPERGNYRFDKDVKAEWDDLKQYDVLFLVTVKPPAPDRNKPFVQQQDGEVVVEEKDFDDADVVVSESENAVPTQFSFPSKWGVVHVRGCEIVKLLDEELNQINDPNPEKKFHRVIGRKRTAKIKLDPAQYQLDKDNKKDGEVYSSFNMIIRRRSKENNFKAILETIRDIMNTQLKLPQWLSDVFLGYGDPKACQNITTPLQTIDFNDTLISKEHLEASFPKRKITYNGADDPTKIVPPFKVFFPDKATLLSDDPEAVDPDAPPLVVTPYVLPNQGPYPYNQPKKNSVPFTAVQVNAVKRAMNTGLTLVVGPPGTGKTDVAVQIINNWYHNFPNQRTLIITHSNQALNQIFEKIMCLDINERHLLRLGHGQKELETEKDFSKFGRVNFMLSLRLKLLKKANKLAESLGLIPKSEVSSTSDDDDTYYDNFTCETARHFFTYHVLSKWESFQEQSTSYYNKLSKDSMDVEEKKTSDDMVVVVENDDSKEPKKTENIVDVLFPFKEFFNDVPQLFHGKSYEEDKEIADGCFRYIRSIFDQLDDCRAFELLKSSYDRGNYLLMKQAKIIAMTCTHAALKRHELIELGFKFDNILMEEAAQILEIETFIPVLLQDQDPEAPPRLKRIVLIGDHNQLPPVVKNMAIQKYGKLDQSLFARFVRLGVPYIELDKQGKPTHYKYHNQLLSLPINTILPAS